MTEMNTEATAEVAVEEAVETPTTEEASQDAVQNTQSEQEWPDVAAILDKIFADLESESPKEPETEEKKSFWPKVKEVLHESEAKALLENVQKELDLKNSELATKEWEVLTVSEKNTALIQELEAIKLEKDSANEAIQKQKEDIETLEEFYKALNSVPVLGELVDMVAQHGAEAVDIPKYLKELVDSKIMAQGTEPTTRQSEPPARKSSTASFEAAILRRNKR